MSDPWSIIRLVYSGRDWGCHGWVEMQECSGQLSLISISLNAHYNIKYSISENVAHFLLVLFTMPVLLPRLTNCPPKGSNSVCSPCSVAVYMTSSLSLGKYPDILAQLFWQQQFLPYGVHVLPEKISFRSFCACCRNINFHGELEMQIMCLDSLCKSLLCSHLYRTLRKAKESETRGKKGKNKEKGEKTGSIFCPLWYPVLIENKFFWVSCIIILIKENIFWQGSKN